MSVEEATPAFPAVSVPPGAGGLAEPSALDRGQSDHLPGRVREQPEGNPRHGCRRLDDRPALRHRSVQGSGHVLDSHEERDQRRAALQRTDATRYRALDSGVYVAVAGHPPSWEGPAEQLPEERPRRVRV